MDWRTQYFNEKLCKGTLEDNSGRCDADDSIVVKGHIKSSNLDATVMYWAANPAPRNYSFTGSGLPFGSPEQAFDRSPNVGAVKTNNGFFEIKLRRPNAYYVGLGTIYIKPQVYLKVCGEKGYDTITLGEGTPYRTLSHPSPRDGPEFYQSNLPLPIRGQETIIRSTAYPSDYKMADNFWGLKPAN